MTRLAANLSMMFTELPFLDRFAAAAAAGFTAVEFLFPYGETVEAVVEQVAACRQQVVLFNFPAGDWNAGERGIAALPGREEECRAGVDTALAYARALSCKRLHLMPGLVPAGIDRESCAETFVANARFAADRLASEGIDMMLEPLNTRVDMPGYFYDTSVSALTMLRWIARPNVKLQYDVYHMQVMEGDLLRRIERLLPHIGHVQIADNPGRGEPGTGEINFEVLLRRLDQLGYDGHVGCEYKPVAGTSEGLGWAAPYLGQTEGLTA